MDKAMAKKLTRKELVEKGETIGAILMRAALAGKTTEQALKDVKRKYPKAATTFKSYAFYKSALRKAGVKVPEPKLAAAA